MIKYITPFVTAVALAGCLFDEPKMPAPKPEDYKGMQGCLAVGFAPQLSIKDIDGDGTADLIQTMNYAGWMSSDAHLDGRGYYTDGDTSFMTSEIREAATRVLKADQDLAFLLDKEKFEAEQRAEKKKKSE